MTVLEHTFVTGSCQASKIADLAETADNEYYMSAVRTSDKSRARALRGRDRIGKIIEDLGGVRAALSCAACLAELDHQVELQKQAIQEIDQMWRE